MTAPRRVRVETRTCACTPVRASGHGNTAGHAVATAGAAHQKQQLPTLYDSPGVRTGSLLVVWAFVYGCAHSVLCATPAVRAVTAPLYRSRGDGLSLRHRTGQAILVGALLLAVARGPTATAAQSAPATAAATGAGAGAGNFNAGAFGDVGAAAQGTDPCLSSPCANGGVCRSGVLSPDGVGPWVFQCICPAAFSGVRCEANVNECASNPCANGGTCTDAVAGFVCTCAGGFGGTRCDAISAAAVDPCALVPCAHGGVCTRTATSGGFQCACPSGWTGALCTTQAIATSSSCARNCTAHGTCLAVAAPLGSAAAAATSSATVPMCACELGWVQSDCSVSAPLLICPDSNLCLVWTYDATNAYVQIIANTPGWFAIVVGGDRSDPLTGDAWLFAVDDTTGQVTAVDAWASGQYVFPSVDARQDLTGVTAYQVANQTVVSFARKLCTGDAQDAVLSPGAMTMAYVLGGGSDSFVPFGQAHAAALWSMWWFGLNGIGSATSPPRALTLMSAAATHVTVAWSAPACASTAAADYYDVSTTDLSNGTSAPLFQSVESAVTLAGLRPATSYNVSVRAHNAYGTSDWTSLRVTTGSTDPSDGTAGPPNAPAPPTLDAVTPTSLIVAYAAPDGVGSGAAAADDLVFVVQTAALPTADAPAPAPDASAWRTVCSGSAQTCRIDGLTPGAHYAARVAVRSVAGSSPFSAAVVFATTSPTPITPPPSSTGAGGGAGTDPLTEQRSGTAAVHSVADTIVAFAPLLLAIFFSNFM